MKGLSVRAAAAEAGDRIGLVFGERTWTWAELARLAERDMAAAEADAGAGPVAFDAHPTPDTVVRMFALIEAGIPFVPLHPRLTARERTRQLHLLAGRSVARGTRPEDPLAFLFTSGSASAARAVELSRRAFLASAAASAERLGWGPDDRWLCCLPLAHVGGLSVLTRCLVARRPIVLAERFDAAEAARAMEQDRVTLTSLVPTMLTRLMELEPAWAPPPTLRLVLLGGAPASAALWAAIRSRGVPAVATYGLTEACSQVATARPGAPTDLVPLEGIDVDVVGGEIRVRGTVMCTRVIGAERRPGPDGFLATGDLGRLRDDGVLEVTGRADQLIVTGGENVSPEEVEAVLESHASVARALVYGVPDPEWGHTVAAALVPAGVPPERGEFEAWMTSRLAPFRRPRRIDWVDRLPETGAGKLDRRSFERAAPETGDGP